MLRTLHLMNAWHASSGGISTFYRALLKASNQVEWRCRLVVPSDSTRYEPTGPHSGIYHLRAPRAPFSPGYRILYPQHYLLPHGEIRRILREEQPDVVEVCDKYTLLYLAGLLRIGWMKECEHRPALIGLSCERMDETVEAYLGASRFARLLSRAYMRSIYFPLFDHHIAVSRHTSAELERAYHRRTPERGISIRGMGVDCTLFTPLRRSPERRARLLRTANAPEEGVLLLYAGRLAPEKNLNLLCDLLDWLDHRACAYKLLIAGDGPGRDVFLRDCRRSHASRVVYLGHQADRSALADLYANVDIFLHPNPREPFGIAPLEAMASGVPLVAPDSGGVTSYAHSSNAWVVPATADAFSTAIREILREPAERARRVHAARATAEELDWSAACGRFYSLYQDLCQPAVCAGSALRNPVIG
jgi:alpha-1,6-mannosyltransferase